MVVKRPMVAFLTLIAAGIRNNPATNTTPEQQQSAINYFETLGGRLIDIPTKCEQANSAMTEAGTQEQQAEADIRST